MRDSIDRFIVDRRLNNKLVLSEYECKMFANSCCQSIVMPHDVETLDERCTMVLGGDSFIEVVGQGGLHVAVGEALPFTLLHHSYTPVDIGREAISQVVVGTESAQCIE